MSQNEAADRSNQPIARFRYGGVSASVFINERKRADGTTFEVKNAVLQRTFVDAEGQYRTTNSFGPQDLPRAILALARAYEFCVRSREPGEEEDWF